MNLFQIGEFYPHPLHKERIDRYRANKRLFKGDHYGVLERKAAHLSGRQANLLYITANIAGIICKKSADFLFGETPVYSAGTSSNAPEQAVIERFVDENELNITNYESALGNSYRGDSFYKIRWGQRYAGLLPVESDPFRILIEAQNAEYVFPETSPMDGNTIMAYHIAYPQVVVTENQQKFSLNPLEWFQADKFGSNEEWILNVESHYPGVIKYSKYRMNPISYEAFTNEVSQWKIYAEITDERREVLTGVPFPLVVHVPNYATDDHWEGIDDLTEHTAIFDEINNRLSKIAEILDKHSDPAMAVPAGTLGEDENGQPIFHAGRDKIFEVMDKSEVIPQYITWNGQLDAAFKELEKLVDLLLMNAEIPAVALGKDNSGTSGASGLSVKWRMNSLLAKINRKRQYYDKGLKRVLLIAQLLEHAQSDEKLDYKVTTPIIRFKDGLPDDDLEQSTIAQIQTGGKATISQLSAIMNLHGYTEEQARIELERIREEEKAEGFVESTVFNDEGGDA
ncbi:phage portal protein [Cytobacillus massiliigabonensis]|uniref:phage portal protein n=1 Tax=Cytobacillus massiliigabonensis TaxID=1871011 RepID=UPI000C835160|nr:phage portal protein [Cytobacillus massiliigabonensis]